MKKPLHGLSLALITFLTVALSYGCYPRKGHHPIRPNEVKDSKNNIIGTWVRNYPGKPGVLEIESPKGFHFFVHYEKAAFELPIEIYAPTTKGVQSKNKTPYAKAAALALLVPQTVYYTWNNKDATGKIELQEGCTSIRRSDGVWEVWAGDSSHLVENFRYTLMNTARQSSSAAYKLNVCDAKEAGIPMALNPPYYKGNNPKPLGPTPVMDSPAQDEVSDSSTKSTHTKGVATKKA